MAARDNCLLHGSCGSLVARRGPSETRSGRLGGCPRVPGLRGGGVLGRVWPQSRGRPEDGGGDSRLPPGRLPLPSRPVMLAPPWLLDRSGKPPTLAHRPHVWSVASWTGARGVRPQSRGPRSPCRRWPGGLCSLRRGRRGRTEVTASPPNRASSCVSRPRPCVRVTWSDFKNCSKPGLDLRASIFWSGVRPTHWHF